MAKIYTAQEVRKMISRIKGYLGGVVLERDYEFLHHVADTLEREDNREKKYEYKAQATIDGTLCVESDIYESIEELKDTERISEIENVTIVRREVGEWEEVKDGK